MRRSLLFIPGNNPGMIQNCDIFGSDSIIFDLEDAVSIYEKDSARCLVSSFLENKKFDFEVIVRINALDTTFFLDDIKSLKESVDTILLPKASLTDLEKLAQTLKELNKSFKVIALIETTKSLLEVEKICAFPLIDGILFGAEDYTQDLGVVRTKISDEIDYPRKKIAVCASAYKIDAIDTPFVDLEDPYFLEEETKYIKSIGMSAKCCIHPNQIDTINKVFTPTEEEINYALKVITASKEAFDKNLGVFSLDGKMIDKPIIKRAENLIEKAKRFKVL